MGDMCVDHAPAVNGRIRRYAVNVQQFYRMNRITNAAIYVLHFNCVKTPAHGNNRVVKVV